MKKIQNSQSWDERLGLKVSAEIGDRIGVQLPVQEIYLSLTNHLGQLSLAIHPWVGAMSTG